MLYYDPSRYEATGDEMLTTNERVVSTSALTEPLAQLLENAEREPILLLDDGRPAAYVLGVEFFDALMAQFNALEQAELRENIAQGEADLARGAYKTLDEAGDQLLFGDVAASNG